MALVMKLMFLDQDRQRLEIAETGVLSTEVDKMGTMLVEELRLGNDDEPQLVIQRGADTGYVFLPGLRECEVWRPAPGKPETKKDGAKYRKWVLEFKALCVTRPDRPLSFKAPFNLVIKLSGGTYLRITLRDDGGGSKAAQELKV